MLGVGLCYVYFQIPLMVILITPALEGLEPEWEEAARNLGATKLAYLRHVAVPVLAPSFIGATLILFGNAFSAYATALALVGSTLRSSCPHRSTTRFNGNVLVNSIAGRTCARRRDDPRGRGRDDRLLARPAARRKVAAMSRPDDGPRRSLFAEGPGGAESQRAGRRGRPRAWRVAIFVLAAIFFLRAAALRRSSSA